MTALYILLGIAAFLLLLMMIPVKFETGYDGEFFARIKVLFFGYDLTKTGKKHKKGKKKETLELKLAKRDKDEKDTEKKVGKVFSQLKKTLAVLVKKSSRHLHIELREFTLSVATGDAAQTALICGALSGTVISFFKWLDENAKFQAPPDVYLGVQPDFIGEKTKFSIDLRAKALFIELLIIAVPTYFTYIKNKPEKAKKSAKSIKKHAKSA